MRKGMKREQVTVLESRQAGEGVLLKLETTMVRELRAGETLFLGEAGQVLHPLLPGAPLQAYVHGEHALAQCPAGASLELSGPQSSSLPELMAGCLILARGAGVAMAHFLAAELKQARRAPAMLWLEAKRAFPFAPAPSAFVLPAPPAVIAASPLLEAWQLPGRLALQAGAPGCYHGSLVELFREHAGLADQAGEVCLLGDDTFIAELSALPVLQRRHLVTRVC